MTLRMFIIALLVLACGFTLRMTWEEIAHPTTPAFAQTDQYDCESFGSQHSAQAELERDLSDPNDLDPDANGIACEEYDYGREEGAALRRRPLAAAQLQLPPRRTISTTKTLGRAPSLRLEDLPVAPLHRCRTAAARWNSPPNRAEPATGDHRSGTRTEVLTAVGVASLFPSVKERWFK
ncbi:MAG: hypothetical protein M3N09_10230 [Actinomycetota bacterium]|nr:hypothetical protein [Actinomycetota bacterium]